MPTFVSTSPRDNSSYASRPPGDKGNPLFSPENDPSKHLPGAKLAYMDCIEDDKYRVVDHCPPGGVALTGRPLEKGVVDGVGGGSDQCIYITAKVDGVLLRGVFTRRVRGVERGVLLHKGLDAPRLGLVVGPLIVLRGGGSRGRW